MTSQTDRLRARDRNNKKETFRGKILENVSFHLLLIKYSMWPVEQQQQAEEEQEEDVVDNF